MRLATHISVLRTLSWARAFNVLWNLRPRVVGGGVQRLAGGAMKHWKTTGKRKSFQRTQIMRSLCVLGTDYDACWMRDHRVVVPSEQSPWLTPLCLAFLNQSQQMGMWILEIKYEVRSISVLIIHFWSVPFEHFQTYRFEENLGAVPNEPLDKNAKSPKTIEMILNAHFPRKEQRVSKVYTLFVWVEIWFWWELSILFATYSI